MNEPRLYQEALGMEPKDLALYLRISISLVSMVNKGKRELQGPALVRFSRMDRMLLAARSATPDTIASPQLQDKDRKEINTRLLVCRNQVKSVTELLQRTKGKFRQGILMQQWIREFRDMEPVLYSEDQDLFNKWEREAGYRIADNGMARQQILQARLDLLTKEEEKWLAMLDE